MYRQELYGNIPAMSILNSIPLEYNIERNDLISMRGFTFKLEDKILNAIWDEE